MLLGMIEGSAHDERVGRSPLRIRNPGTLGLEESADGLDADGRRRCVTRSTDYFSSAPSIAAVGPTGLVEAGTIPGDAAILVRHLGRVATVRAGGVRPETVVVLTPRRTLLALVLESIALQRGVLLRATGNYTRFDELRARRRRKLRALG